ncbi:MAG: Rieske 2Fe-2S domain-containing protein [Ilumatobacteraceae bacterium]|nr:Rieske 2Fe-2S domain-containing protein [Ilumatobacteraceae bacterium]
MAGNTDPHRCASMFLGRNEEGGLRCVYHGWKFDTEGRAIEIPNLPPAQEEGFKQTVKAKSHRVEERNGLIWVYMGPRETPPPLPMLEATMMPIDDMQLAWAQRDCNWLQSLEGDIDTSHFGFLHAGHLDGNDFADDDLVRYTVVNRAPEYHAIETDWGTSYGAHRETSAGETYWRVANYLFPFWSQTPAPPFANNVHARAWVPMDDEPTMCVHLGWKGARGPARPTPPVPTARRSSASATPASPRAWGRSPITRRNISCRPTG